MPTSADDLHATLERLLAVEDDARAALASELPPSLAEPLARLLAGPEPEAALRRALSLPASHLQTPPSAAAVDLLHQGSYPARLMRLLEAPRVAAILADDPTTESLSEQMQRELERRPLAEAIAVFRTSSYLHLARRELEHAPLEEVGAALSDVASVCIDAALRGVDEQLARDVCVFGMGKLGGHELNFLSDIDLVFVHRDDAIVADDESAAHRQRTALHAKLRKVLRLLEGSGVWRPLFHVDLRLRPFGTRGPLSLSASALERYYERHGRGWERQAWLRARSVAGNHALGEDVLARLTPFVWPRSRGPELFEETRAMMQRARAQAHGSIGAANLDLKHDAGGIREIEFFVQSLQLLAGGRDPSVRARPTLVACDRLAAAGHLSDREHEILARAYRVLRRIEHRVQLVEGLQTHRVPADADARALLAKRLAVRAPPTWLVGAVRQLPPEREPAPPQTLASFDAALTELRAQVQTITGTLTGESELAQDSATRRSIARAVVLDPGASKRSRLDALADFDLWPEAAEEVSAMLDHLLSRPDGALASTGASQAGAQKLLIACLDSANPVEAVRLLIEFAATRPAHLALWRVLADPSSTQLVRQIADLFGTSEPLSRGLIGFGGSVPELRGGDARDGGLSLLLEAATSGLPSADELRERLAQLGRDAPLDQRLFAFKHRQLVRIGLYDLAHRPDPLTIGRCLSDLAELVVRELLVDLAHAGGDAGPSFTLAVLTLGKFGMQAMDYGSDLDLMFVYEPAAGVSSTAARDAAQRVSRKLIARLEDRSRGLRLYEVDMRLRPSGRQGLLVSSSEGFRSYHARPLAIWERLALVRLRAVAEQRFEAGVGAGVGRLTPAQDGAVATPGPLAEAIVGEVVPASVWPPTPASERADAWREIVAQTRSLKQRIEAELAQETREQLDIKTGVGGSLELELLISALQLRHEVRARDIPSAIAELARLGALAPSEASELDRAYAFTRRLLNRLRMSLGRGGGRGDRLKVNSPRLTALARRMGLADRDALVSTLSRERALIRSAFERHLPLDHIHAGVH